MKKKLIISLAMSLAVIACLGIFVTPVIHAGASLFYNYPITFYANSFVRFNSNHDSYSITVKQGTSTTSGVIKSSWSGYGSQIIKELNLENGKVTKTTYSNNIVQTTQTINPPSLGGNKANYLTILRELKTDVEFVEMGRASDFSPDKTELRSTNVYLSKILYQIEKPLKDTITYWSMDQNVSTYVSLPNNLRPGMTFNLKLKAAASVERELLVDFFINSKYVSSKRYPLPAGEDAFKGSFTIPTTATPTETAQFYYKIIPKGGTWQQKTAETSTPVMVKPPYEITDLYAYKNYSGAGLVYGVGYYIPKDMDLRIDIIDTATGKWVWGKQSTYRYSSTKAGNGEFYDTVTPPLIVGKSYKLYVKILPIGGAWNTFLTEKSTDFIFE